MFEALAAQAIGGALSKKGGGAAKPSQSAGPSNSEGTAAAYGSGLDGSNWAVNFKGIQGASGSSDKTDGLGIGGIPQWALLAVAGAIAWKMFRSK